MTSSRTPLASLLLLVATAGPIQAQTFSEGDFAGWVSLASALQGPGSNASFAPSPGGNPSPSITVTCNPIPTPTEQGLAFLSLWHPSNVYNPSVYGPIQSISMLVDFKSDPTVGGGNQAIRIVAIQNGRHYMGAAKTTGLSTTWQTLSTSSSSAQNFYEMPSFNYTSHPDFSAGAPPITFGFAVANSAPAGSTAYTLTNDYDNWELSINCTVPRSPASSRNIGQGCPDPVFGPSALGSRDNSLPYVGRQLELLATSLPPSTTNYTAFALLGTSEVIPHVDLGFTGLFRPACFLYVNPVLGLPMPRLAPTTANLVLVIPCDPTLVGASFFAQVVVLDLSNPGTWLTTNGYEGLIGAL